MSTDSAEFDTGYKRPPKRTRFRKGVSGNPRGRPKGRLNLATVLERTLRETVVINENGVPKTVSKGEAVMKQVVNKAVNGDMVAIRYIMPHPVSAVLETNDAQTKEQSSEADRKLLNRVLERMKDSGRK